MVPTSRTINENMQAGDARAFGCTYVCAPPPFFLNGIIFCELLGLSELEDINSEGLELGDNLG